MNLKTLTYKNFANFPYISNVYFISEKFIAISSNNVKDFIGGLSIYKFFNHKYFNYSELCE